MKALSIASSTISIFIIIGFFILRSEPSDSSMNLECNGYPQSVTLRINGKALLKRKEDIKEEIAAQINFLKGSILSKSSIAFIAMSEKPAKISYKEISPENYSFTAEKDAYLCLKEDTSLESIKLILPLNSDQAYISIPKENWVEKRWQDKSLLVNPCVNSEFVDLQDPKYAWYFWDVHQDLCLSRLKESEMFYQTNVEITNSRKVVNKIKVDSSKLEKTAIILGWVDINNPSIKDRPEILKAISKNDYRVNKFQDRSSETLIVLLRELSIKPGFIVDKIEESGNHLKLIVKFNTVNDQPRNLKIYWGPTDLFSKPQPEHWNFLAEAITHDDNIVYAGHSGLGENLNIKDHFSQIKTKSTELGGTQKPHQLITILSCYSATYFSLSNLNVNAASVNVISTASDIFYFSSSIKFIIKQIFQSQSFYLDQFLKSSSTDDFFIIKNIKRNQI